MHFSVPDSQEIYSEATGTTYTGYNIYINGAFHCCLRYKQLHALHEQLRRRCQLLGGVPLPDFPPKRLLPLTNGQVESRRASLEHYLQLVGQESRISKMELFQKFLFNGQLESAHTDGLFDEYQSNSSANNGDLPPSPQILLADGYQLTVNDGHVNDNSSQLLQKACVGLQLPNHLMERFCLFLARIHGENNDDQQQPSTILLRRLMDFESPCISRLRVTTGSSFPCHILLRTAYWSPTLETALLQHRVTLHLLYIQAVADVRNEWIIATNEIRDHLLELREHGLKREYLETVRHLPLYGCLQFNEALVDYPEPNTLALIAIGNRELSMRTCKGAKIYETKFRVTRMRCWRVTAIHTPSSSSVGNIDGGTPTPSVGERIKDDGDTVNLQLSFEYLMAKQTLRWVTITSAQAMLISVCLQAMVDELMASKDIDANQPDSGVPQSPIGASSMASASSSNGHRSQSTVSSSSSSSHSFSTNEGATTTTTTATTTSSEGSSKSSSPSSPPILQFITQRRTMPHNPKIANSSQSYSGVFYRNVENAFQQNEAFEGIGDDDL